MKVKLLAVLLALISFSSCKKEETSSLELDKSNLITLNGKVGFFLDYGLTITEGSEVTIVVDNSVYGGPAGSQQIFKASIGTDGTFTYDLPLPQAQDETIEVKYILQNIISEEGDIYGYERPIDITLADKEKRTNIYYHKLEDSDQIKYGTLEGKVTIEEGFGVALPAETKIIAQTGDDKISIIVNADGTYKADLPTGKIDKDGNLSNNLTYSLTLPKFEAENKYQFDNLIGEGDDRVAPTTTVEYLVPNYEDLEYKALKTKVDVTANVVNYEVTLPTDLIISIVAANELTYSIPLLSKDLQSTIDTTLYYPSTTSVDLMDLTISKESFVGEDGNTYYAKLSGTTFEYSPKTPSVYIKNAKINGVVITEGETLTLSYSDEDNAITKDVSVTVMLDEDGNYIVKSFVPMDFYIEGKEDRKITCTVKYTDGVSNFESSEKEIDMANTYRIDDLYLSSLTPSVTFHNIRFNGVIIPEGETVTIKLNDPNPDYNFSEELTATVDENNNLVFVIPNSFYVEDDMDRSIAYEAIYNDGTNNYYYASSLSMNNSLSTYIDLSSKAPIAKISAITYNGDKIPVGKTVTIKLEDTKYGISEIITALVEYSDYETNILNFVVPASFVKEGENENNRYISYELIYNDGVENFTYTNNIHMGDSSYQTSANLTSSTPSALIYGIYFNGKIVQIGETVKVKLEDPEYGTTEEITTTVEFDQYNSNMIKFVVPNSFYIEGYTNRNISYELIYNDGTVEYSYNSSIYMGNSYIKYSPNLTGNTPFISLNTLSYNDRINTSILLPANTEVNIEFNDDGYSINETITSIISENNELNFMVPESFYKENDKYRHIDFKISYTVNGMTYIYKSNVRMNDTRSLGNTTLYPYTPVINNSSIYYYDSSWNTVYLKEGDVVGVKLTSSEGVIKSSNQTIDENGDIKFVIPNEFYTEETSTIEYELTFSVGVDSYTGVKTIYSNEGESRFSLRLNKI